MGLGHGPLAPPGQLGTPQGQPGVQSFTSGCPGVAATQGGASAGHIPPLPRMKMWQPSPSSLRSFLALSLELWLLQRTFSPSCPFFPEALRAMKPQPAFRLPAVPHPGLLPGSGKLCWHWGGERVAPVPLPRGMSRHQNLCASSPCTSFSQVPPHPLLPH